MARITLSTNEILRYCESRIPNLKKSGEELRGPCPIHGGERDSFSVNVETGKWHCFSHCNRGGDIFALEAELSGVNGKEAFQAVLNIVGREPESKPRIQPKEITATYSYTDEDGKVLFQCVRYDPKDFRQRRPDGKGGWIWNLKGVRLVLYKLPEVIAAPLIFLCEGEKDVHALIELGVVASTGPMGAGKWRAEYSETLRGKDVVLIPDQDERGRAHMTAVAESLHGIARSIKTITLSNAKDISDWISAGGTREPFAALVEQADSVAVPETEMPATKRKRKAAGMWGLFELREDGVYYVDPDPESHPARICSRLEITAATRSASGENWGRLLEWSDQDGRPHRWAMPIGLLAGSGDELRRRLMDGGLYVGMGRSARERLGLYLQTTSPETRVTCVDRIGWHDGCFVLPDSSIPASGAERVIYQTDAEPDHRLEVQGTAQEWREQVGQLCSGNTRLILAVSCAFAGPLLQITGSESGGIHLVGESSLGKSTALLVAGSVIGGGDKGYVDTWRSTLNGLEAVAGAHNDLTLILDELSQVDAREAAETAYMLANGAGKMRMTRMTGLRRRLGWRLLFLSAGEITLADHSASAGRRTRGGAEVRLLNIPADAGKGMGIIEDLHGSASSEALVDRLGSAARKYYGAPIRAFLPKLIAHHQEIIDELPAFRRYIVDQFAATSGEVLRAADRLALIASAGEMATEWGLKPPMAGPKSSRPKCEGEMRRQDGRQRGNSVSEALTRGDVA